MTKPPTASAGPTEKDRRAAALAAHLAAGVRSGAVEAADALRVLRHELRRRNTNSTLKIERRSVAAQAVVDTYARAGEPIPKNGSDDALHADHVYALNAETLETLVSPEDWVSELERLRTVVCVTARENYNLMKVEKQGHWGWGKYDLAGITFVGPGGAPTLTE
jgi:hypothetical protein